MELFSLAFLLFVGVLLACYYAVGALAHRGQWVVLLVGSLVFYCVMGTWKTLAFVLFTALVCWGAALAFARVEAASKAARKAAASRAEKKAIKARFGRRKRVVFVIALLACFGVLAYLKYWNVILYEVGLAPSPTSLGLLLPLGISFYTFQSVSYLIDTYNDKYAPQANPARYLLFVSYFPQLLQGPINRYDKLGAQLFEPHRLRDAQMRRAGLLFLYGAFKKYIIANMTVSDIDAIFSHVNEGMPGSVIVYGILLYSAYQYADFSGGIDMVMATSEAFGIRMAPNFRQPYFSVSLADFWRRWHITLGAWMRDYVFYPFALTHPMQRLGKWCTAHLGQHMGRTLPACLANILVFFIVGLWHGAEAHYIAWGLYNGIVIALADLCAPLFARMNRALHVNTNAWYHHLFAILRTFVVVNIGWYFDRIYDFGDALLALKLTVTNFDAAGFAAGIAQVGIGATHVSRLVVLACLVVLVVSVARERGVDVRGRVLALPVVARALVYMGALFMIAASFYYTANVAGGFMYANF